MPSCLPINPAALTRCSPQVTPEEVPNLLCRLPDAATLAPLLEREGSGGGGANSSSSEDSDRPAALDRSSLLEGFCVALVTLPPQHAAADASSEAQLPGEALPSLGFASCPPKGTSLPVQLLLG